MVSSELLAGRCRAVAQRHAPGGLLLVDSNGLPLLLKLSYDLFRGKVEIDFCRGKPVMS
jgi:hypothetical protein